MCSSTTTRNPSAFSNTGAVMQSLRYLTTLLGTISALLVFAQEPDSRRTSEDRAIWQAIDSAGPQKNLSILKAKLDSLDYMTTQPDRYATSVMTAFNTLYERGTDDLERARRLEQLYLLSAFERPDRLPTDSVLHLALRLRTDWTSGTLPKADETRSKVNLLFLAWRRLEDDIKSGFDFHDLPNENVMPPAAAGGYPGMEPTLISDPRLRGQYLDAIERNRAKIAEYNLQAYLRDVKGRFLRHIVFCLRYAIESDAVTATEVYSNLNLVRNEASQQYVLAALRHRKSK
jgi:hypothetical protein